MTEDEMTELENYRRGAAYHEAGHAVVAWILGQRISDARVYPKITGGVSGVVRFKKDLYGLRAWQTLCETGCRDIALAADILVCFAGPIAHMVAVERSAWDHVALFGSFSDTKAIMKRLAAMDCTDEQRAWRAALLLNLCSDFLFRHLKHVEDLAHALLANDRFLKAKEIRQILGPRTMPLRRAIADVRLALDRSLALP
jgi:hypothetical protein